MGKPDESLASEPALDRSWRTKPGDWEVRLDGVWFNPTGEAVTIVGRTARWLDGSAAEFTRLADPGRFIMLHQGSYYHAELRNGQLVWNDGDIWTAQEPVGGLDTTIKQNSVLEDSHISASGTDDLNISLSHWWTSPEKETAPGLNRAVPSVAMNVSTLRQNDSVDELGLTQWYMDGKPRPCGRSPNTVEYQMAR